MCPRVHSHAKKCEVQARHPQDLLQCLQTFSLRSEPDVCSSPGPACGSQTSRQCFEHHLVCWQCIPSLLGSTSAGSFPTLILVK
jgi:hypothetical protein